MWRWREEDLPGHLPPVPVELDGVAHLAVQEAVGQRDEEPLKKRITQYHSMYIATQPAILAEVHMY